MGIRCVDDMFFVSFVSLISHVSYVFIGMQERITGRRRHIFLGRFRTRAKIMPVIIKYVRYGTTIMTDNYSPYWVLPERGYQHYMVSHSIEFVNSWDTWVHTNTVEGGFSHVKDYVNTMCGKNGVRNKYIQMALDEYDFRSMWINPYAKGRWKRMARLIARYGTDALQWVETNNAHKY